MRRIVYLAALMTCAVLVGCSSSRAGTATTTPRPAETSAHYSADEAAMPSPAELYAKVRSGVVAAGSGQFTQNDTSNFGDGTVTVTASGSYDLKARSWQEHLQFGSDSPTFMAKNPDLTKLDSDYLGIGPDAYDSQWSWPSALRGRWRQVTTAKSVNPLIAKELGGPKAASPETLAALLRLSPTKVQPAESGWILTGQIPAATAILALGLGKTVRAMGVTVPTMQGSAQMTVDVGADGLPTGLQLEGKSVVLTSTVPASLIQALPYQTGNLQLRDLGRPVSVLRPVGDKLITPSEVKSLGLQ